MASTIDIGNCKVLVDANSFTCKSDSNAIEIAISAQAKIKISVKKEKICSPPDDYTFVLVNPKDVDSNSVSCLQEVLRMYKSELPAMNYAANTGKASMFLEKCVKSGKYSTLLLKSNYDSEEIIAAITYQIVPADIQCAEVPLLAVHSEYQHKGFGCLLYMELRKRLQSVGIRTLYCWGDKESEGFWLKQGFSSIAEVDRKGRARRLPVKANIRKALCFPGGSTLMVSHLNVELSKKFLSATDASFQSGANGIESSDHESLNGGGLSGQNTNFVAPFYGGESNVELAKVEADADAKNCSSYSPGRKRIWEASLTALNSKKVKGIHNTLVESDFDLQDDSFVKDANNLSLNTNYMDNNVKEDTMLALISDIPVSEGSVSKEPQFIIMLMDIADDTKKRYLSKVIETLGGAVTSDGSSTTHIITRKVRRTFNFCLALCSGAWIVSSTWLKESLREGRFVEESPYILNDEEYAFNYDTELKNAMLRAKERPHGLFKGYNLCMGSQVHTSCGFSSTLVRSAGGNIISGLDKVKEASTTIFIASDEDIEEALAAEKIGLRSFSTTWLMDCIMRQELDFAAQGFVESL